MKTFTKDIQKNTSPDQALQLLRDGNRRFVEKQAASRDLLQQVQATALGQAPFAAIVGCIDSRVPAELVFDQGIGDIFNARVAGNVLNEDILGSLEFACKVAGSKAIVILGHTSCGAVGGAIKGVELGNLTGLLEKIAPAVTACRSEGTSDESLPGAVVRKNVQLMVAELSEKSPVLAEMMETGEIAVKGAVYDVETGVVEWL